MCGCHRRNVLGLAVGALASTAFAGVAFAEPAEKPTGAAGDKPKIYTCPPCGCPNDGKDLPGPGDCPICAMPLVEKTPPAAKTEPPKASLAKPAEKPSPKAE